MSKVQPADNLMIKHCKAWVLTSPYFLAVCFPGLARRTALDQIFSKLSKRRRCSTLSMKSNLKSWRLCFNLLDISHQQHYRITCGQRHMFVQFLVIQVAALLDLQEANIDRILCSIFHVNKLNNQNSFCVYVFHTKNK